MKKILETVLKGTLGLAMIVGGCAAVPSQSQRTRCQQREIIRLPLEKRLYEITKDNDFDRAEAAFIASGVDEHELQYLMGFTDRLLKEISEKKKLDKISDKKQKARAIFEYLCESSAPQRYEEKGKKLSYTVRSLRGDCVGLSFLTMSLSERAGIPMTLMRIPGHVFPSMDYNGKKVYIEITERNGFDWSLPMILGQDKWEIGIRPNSLGKKQSIAILLQNLGSIEENEKKYNKALGLYIASATILPNENNTSGISHLSRRLYGDEKELRLLRDIYNKHPQNTSIIERLSKALAHRAKPGDITEATRLYQSIINKFPDDEFRNSFMGNLYARQKRFDEAAKYFQRANKPKG